MENKESIWNTDQSDCNKWPRLHYYSSLRGSISTPRICPTIIQFELVGGGCCSIRDYKLN
ncbi:hypothetical protein Ahy_B07g087855 isoform D [Arachis hypogaea]|uniref:Uncharacterized protein n=1 Tax=Arachis hypogaea TaxID=3818 RepID=A0A444YD47_ARAHY|nr:hypothetical protein Ahy_B07g087855 isoform D [Arachis hypogaea]